MLKAVRFNFNFHFVDSFARESRDCATFKKISAIHPVDNVSLRFSIHTVVCSFINCPRFFRFQFRPPRW